MCFRQRHIDTGQDAASDCTTCSYSCDRCSDTVQGILKEHAVVVWETVQVMKKIVMIAMLDMDVNTQAVDFLAQVALVGVTGLTIAQRMVIGITVLVLGQNVCGSANGAYKIFKQYITKNIYKVI